MAIPFRMKTPTTSVTVVKANVSRKQKADWRLWVGVIFIVCAVFSTSRLLATAGARTDALQITHDVATGTLVTPDDVRVVRVALPDGVSYLNSPDSLIGNYATRNLYSNDLLQSNSVSTSIPREYRAISVPIRAGHLPSITTGSVVDVWVTPSTQGLSLPGPPYLAVARVAVSSVPDGIDSNTDTAVTLLVPNSAVPKLMAALRDGLIDLAVVPTSDGV